MIYKMRGRGEKRELRIRQERNDDVDMTELSRFCNMELDYSLFNYENSGKDLIFQLSERVELSSYLLKERNLEDILNIMRQCILFFKSILIKGFFLPFSVLDMDKIWVSEDGNVNFIYIPTDEMRVEKTLIDFFLELLSLVRTSDDSCRKGVDYLVEKLLNLPYYDEESITKMLESCREGDSEDNNDKFRQETESPGDNVVYRGAPCQGKIELLKSRESESHLGGYVCNLNTGEILGIAPKDVLEVKGHDIEFVIKSL